MKKALRIIVPLVLALAIIACAAWYFLIYDPGFTKEVLLSQARKFEASGNYKISAFIYDLAYNQSSQDDDVALELAQQYLDMGNYTKAEYTLTNAIRTNPTTQLYVTLSSVFVQQDKLLDAVNLLNGVSDPTISKELDALRPQAPALTPEPGFYSEYVTVGVQSNGATLYVSTDADYPSMKEDLYQEPIQLTTGETVIYALAVNKLGLVSPLVISGYTVEGVVELVTFADPAVEAVIREAIGATEADPIYTNQLWSVKSITVPAEAKSYDDLQYLPRLTRLTIEPGSEGDLAVLDSFEALQELYLSKIKLSDEDISRIAAQTTLQQLSLSGCSLSNISELAQLTELEWLDLSDNTLRNISALSAMPKLKYLLLYNNVINTLEPIAGLTDLIYVDISYNAVASLEPLKDMKQLCQLFVSNNQVGSVAPLSGLTALQTLHVAHNNLEDLSVLSTLPELVELNASNNAITSMEGLQKIAHLRLLDLSYNQITDLPAFQKDSELVNINMDHNLLLNVEALAGLSWLNTVNIDYNEEVEDLLPLDSCPVLVRVNAFGTKVTEVSFLTAKSIIVNFDPTLVVKDEK